MPRISAMILMILMMKTKMILTVTKMECGGVGASFEVDFMFFDLLYFVLRSTPLEQP